MKEEGDPLYFPTPEDFRKWLIENHQDQSQLWVGYYKKASGIRSITWPESVDQALCFGWIDGIRKSIDELRYKIRFTPRKAQSHWSDVNIKKVQVLKKMGLMENAGLMAFERRKEKRSRQASNEQKKIILREDYENKIRNSEKAWMYFKDQSPSYRNQTIRWIMSAKKEETRLKRLNILIRSSENQEVIPPLKWTK